MAIKRKTILVITSIFISILTLIIISQSQGMTKLFLRILGHYATPKFESDSSILSKTKEVNLHYDRLYKIRDFKAFNELVDRNLTTVPFVQIYNHDQELISLASGNECLWVLMDFFSKKDSTAFVTGDSLMYDFIRNRLTPIDLRSDQDTFNTYIFAGWANYIPKLSNKLFAQTNKIAHTLKVDVCLSYINLDYQEEWEADVNVKGNPPSGE